MPFLAYEITVSSQVILMSIQRKQPPHPVQVAPLWLEYTESQISYSQNEA